jgi:CelD/BcsL family acetyltransferase involved in cellulose biosynthesis
MGPLASEWDRLARDAGSPFLTSAWLTSWWSAFGGAEPLWLLSCDDAGALRAGAFLCRSRGRLAAAANVHSGDWDAVSCDASARDQLWEALAALGARRVHLQAMPEGARGTGVARGELQRAGYRVLSVPGPFCPWLTLPASFDELLAGASSGLRQQVRRRRRGLEQAGALAFRMVRGGSTLDADLETFLALEASGWKGRSGTAILSRPSTARLYREFARAAAQEGWLRLGVLELDGVAIAASYDCAFEGRAYLLKTTFSEAHARLSPGLVLLAEVLRSLIDEGMRSYDFLGDPDTYKTRWTAERHPRTQIFAYRGRASGGYVYRRSVRPRLKAARDRLRVRPR